MATMQDCIANCLDCHSVCLVTIGHCLNKGGEHAESAHIRLLQDCAQICIASADFMLRGSPWHRMTCRLCAGICEKCAEDCAKIADDETMVLCVEACRRCASSCSEMAAAEQRAA
jgi:hypothetical protein